MKRYSIFLIFQFFESTIANPVAEIFDNCPDEELQAECNGLCRADFNKCRLLCETEYCLSICDREYSGCLDNCPCGANCEQGCVGCDSPLCPHILVMGERLPQAFSISLDGSRKTPAKIKAPSLRYLQGTAHALVNGELFVFGASFWSRNTEDDAHDRAGDTRNDFPREDFFDPFPRLNETCTDLDLGELCSTNCSEDLLQCLSNCNSGDASCENACVREGFDCIDGCPCHIDCPGGCEDCPAEICDVCAFPEENEDHVKCLADLEQELFDCIGKCGGNSSCLTLCTLQYSEDILSCPCEEGCPNGCPCPNYDCYDPSKELNSVLLMHYNHRDTTALVNFESYIDDLEISWFNNGPDNLEFFSKEGCSVLYKGTNYLFGGWFVIGGEREYGPHILNGCDIEKAEGVSFQFDCFEGSVGYLPSQDDPEGHILLYNGYGKVQSYDGSKIVEASLAVPDESHVAIGGHIPTYKGNPILIAGYDQYAQRYTRSVEQYSENDGWINDYRILFPESYIESYSSVWGDFGVVIFPGDSQTVQYIWRLYNDEWTQIGTPEWTPRRYYARALLFPNNEVMVVGGDGPRKFTKFTFNDDFTSIEGEDLDHLPQTDDYDDPFAILVPDGFCML
ncbi:Oidioi.mRNA.OKI2018_I69.chr1.g3641.t1.cds [Oikopleura dioica]|uniref:Oidioi.mRNA.OKI2018_I69.chr1.g3641.t1.cds n=1 Tax=Oikopleura dioica TaxID=34765 RepID=A0ABN7SYD0_OIKDI|nr:Oidioi.mRNA.OKI2018_I69.chr1.g3641.t1.cds [Oikopleura dioica]